MHETMPYQCLSQQTFNKDQYQLTSLRYEDIQQIKNWRNEQIQFLRQKTPLTDEMQEQYFRNTILPSFSEKQPKQILFSFLYNHHLIGYGGLVHINWTSRHAEVSFLLDFTRAQNNTQYINDFTHFLQIIKQIAFTRLSFHRLYTETFDIRPLHISVLESQGFIFEGRLKEHQLHENRFIDSLIHGCVHHE